MRRFRFAFAGIVSGLFLAGCASGPDIRVDKDPATDMSAYKTFGYFDELATDNSRYSSIVTTHLKQATRRELERVGYTYDEASPDLRVNFFVNVVDKTQIRSTPTPTAGFYGYRAGYYGAWGAYPYDVDTVDYKAGTLAVDLVDQSRKSLVWQGVAEGKVPDKALQNPGAAIDRVVTEIFRNFPNGPQ
jgi:hypothetical protein